MNEHTLSAFVLGAGAVCWVGSLIMIIFYARSQRRYHDLWSWLPSTLMFGPFAAFAYARKLNTRSSTRPLPARAGLLATPTTRLPLPKPPLAPTAPLGSGLYLYVRYGVDATQAVEIPMHSELIVRRGAPDDTSTTGTLVLHDATVSRNQHCRVIKGSQIELEDTSRNGTIVDGQLIRNGRVVLKVGSIIRVGKTTLVVMTHYQPPTSRLAQT